MWGMTNGPLQDMSHGRYAEDMMAPSRADSEFHLVGGKHLQTPYSVSPSERVPLLLTGPWLGRWHHGVVRGAPVDQCSGCWSKSIFIN